MRAAQLKAVLPRELLASVVVFLVALPLCMGIAIASGMPPSKGLITGIIGGLVVGWMAGSPLQVSGPAAGLAVLVFELVRQARVMEILEHDGLRPSQVVSANDVLLEPVSLYQIKHLDNRWIMVRAANMKITLDTADGRIVNISGGGCPDVPWVAHKLCGLRLDEAPDPLSMGQTLCCYSLQKAFEELRRQRACGV